VARASRPSKHGRDAHATWYVYFCRSPYDVIVRGANNALRPNLPAEEFMSILDTAASNRRKDEIKSEKRDKRGGELEKSSLACCSDLIAAEHEEVEEYDECDRRKSLETFLASLPDNFHRTIWKMKLEGVSVTDIAEKLERSRQWINKRIRETRHLVDDLHLHRSVYVCKPKTRTL